MKYLLSVLCIGMAACSTVPTKMLKPNQTAFYREKFKNANLSQVRAELGEPAAQGHWGNAESRFVLQYVETTDPNTLEVPRWAAQNMKAKWQCYNFMFDKNHDNAFEEVYRETCDGGYGPYRIDFDYPTTAQK